MIDPNVNLKEGQRVSLPHEIVSEVFALLSELPAKTSMNLLIAIQQEAEVVSEDPAE